MGYRSDIVLEEHPDLIVLELSRAIFRASPCTESASLLLLALLLDLGLVAVLLLLLLLLLELITGRGQ